MSSELIWRLARRLNPQDPAQTAASLLNSPTFQGDLAWLGRLFAAADALPLPEVPPELSDALVNIAAAEAHQRVSIERAQLVHDSREAGELVGVRGPDESESAWTIVYSTPHADLVIDCTPEGPMTAIRGHLLHRSADQQVGQVEDASGNVLAVSDANGVFDCGVLPAGVHVLRITSAATSFDWELQLS